MTEILWIRAEMTPRKRQGHPKAALTWCLQTSAGTASGWDKTRLPTIAGARGGFRRAPEPVRRLAALHLQSPLKHVNQVRTTSFLW